MKKVMKPVLASLFAAITVVVTMILHIPIPGIGYINLGDVFALYSGILLGPLYGGLAAGLGGALSDLLLGYTMYIPATFIIKALSAVITHFLFKAVRGRETIKALVSCVTAETFMCAGYFLYEFFILGYREAAFSGIGYNAVQGSVSMAFAVVLILSLSKAKINERLR